MQFKYKADTFTTQCSWLVNEVSHYFLRRGTAVTACMLDASMAFDKCSFNLLFQKLLVKGLTVIFVRTLISVYENQTGNVKLSGRRSGTVRIANSTRKGSVLSPAPWCVYLDDLLRKLRDQSLVAKLVVCGWELQAMLTTCSSMRQSCLCLQRWSGPVNSTVGSTT